MHRFETFLHNEETLAVVFIESSEVFPGVICDVYGIPGSTERDLGVISIEASKKTKPQKVLGGDQTIEGFMSGKGTLIILKPSCEKLIYKVGPGDEGLTFMVEVEDIMQWRAEEDLVVYEICYPPYEKGRFENLEDDVID